MYNIEKVEVYEVNGYVVCAKSEECLEEYLSDVPKSMILNKEYKKDSYVILTQRESSNFKCKELQHMKINNLYRTRERAMLYQELLEAGSDQIGYVS